MHADQLHDNFETALKQAAEILTRGSVCMLAREYFGDSAYFHLMLKYSKPSWSKLLYVVYTLGIPIGAILCGDKFVPSPREPLDVAHLKERRPRWVLNDGVKRAEHANDVSAEVARATEALGYTKHLGAPGQTRDRTELDHALIQRLLRENLKRKLPFSILTIRKMLSISAATLLRRHSGLCRRTRKKIEQFHRLRIDEALNRALSAVPPISLEGIATSLGYSSPKILRKLASNAVARLLDRNEQYTKDLIATQRRQVTRLILRTPPLSQTAIAREMGVPKSWLQTHFAEEMKDLDHRRSRYEKEVKVERERNLYSEVKAIVLELEEEGVPINLHAVSIRTKGYKCDWDFHHVRPVLNRVLSELNETRGRELKKAA